MPGTEPVPNGQNTLRLCPSCGATMRGDPGCPECDWQPATKAHPMPINPTQSPGRGGPGRTISVALGVLAALVVAAVAGVLIGRGISSFRSDDAVAVAPGEASASDSPTTTAAPVTTASTQPATTAAPPSSPLPAPTTTIPAPTTTTPPPTTEPANEWIAVLASLDAGSPNDVLQENLGRAMGSTPGAQWVWSDNWASLPPGYVVVYAGYFDTAQSALTFCDNIGRAIPDNCFARILSQDPSDRDSITTGR